MGLGAGEAHTGGAMRGHGWRAPLARVFGRGAMCSRRGRAGVPQAEWTIPGCWQGGRGAERRCDPGKGDSRWRRKEREP